MGIKFFDRVENWHYRTSVTYLGWFALYLKLVLARQYKDDFCQELAVGSAHVSDPRRSH